MLGITPNTSSGEAGLRYQAQQQGTREAASDEQVRKAYEDAQRGIQQQQAFIQAMQGASPQLFQQQQALTDQLIAASQGGGPNPALEQLRQTTGQNVAGQAALMAGQRGAGSNAGLIARQAAQQGAATQQQAVGQAAALAAQQQIAARQQLQSQFGQQVGQQQGALTGYNQAAQSEQQNLLNAVAAQNAANVQARASQTAANAGIAQIAAKGQEQMGMGLFKGVGSAIGTGLGVPSMASGGEVPRYAGGGEVDLHQMLYGSTPSNQAFPQFGVQLTASPDLRDMDEEDKKSGGQKSKPELPGGKELDAMATPEGFQAAGAEELPAAGGIQAAEPILGSAAPLALAAAKGGAIHGESYAKAKKFVPGKAKVKGDSLKNDNVPAMLSPGEIIIPRSIAQHPEAPKKAAEFVAAVLAKSGPRKKR